MQAGLVAATEVRYSPAEPPPPPLVSAEEVIALINQEGTRSRRAYLLYAEISSDGRLQNLVRVVLSEMPDRNRRGLVRGNPGWIEGFSSAGQTITAEVYEAAQDATLAAVARLVETEEGVMTMAKRSLSKADYAALNKGRPVRSYPPGCNRAQIRFGGGGAGGSTGSKGRRGK